MFAHILRENDDFPQILAYFCIILTLVTPVFGAICACRGCREV